MILRFCSFSTAAILLVSLAASANAQEVVFSRRVYAAKGTTYQELWTWSASDGTLKQLTKSSRNHDTPACSPDGKQIFSARAPSTKAALSWNTTGKTLLVGVYGESSTSTSHYQDYFLVDVATKTRTRAMSGNNPVWLPGGNAIIYETTVPTPSGRLTLGCSISRRAEKHCSRRA